jgi:LuxR family transcriptional regulator, quorum-sensing system regulator BjaR1
MRGIEFQTFDFIDRIESVRTPDDVYSLFSHEMLGFGFSNFLITEMPPPGSNLGASIILNGWSRVWFDRYMDQGLYKHDPMAKKTRETTQPFLWSDVKVERPAAKRVMDEAAECGLRDGFSVPIFGSAGEQSCVTMGGERLEIPPRGRQALHLMSIYTHDRARALRGHLTVRPSKPSSTLLTPREREVLKWVALGKTDWEIGEILNIAETTSTAHMQNVCRKLNAATRAQAVAAAMIRREISL